jgi:hypothetical protein
MDALIGQFCIYGIPVRTILLGPLASRERVRRPTNPGHKETSGTQWNTSLPVAALQLRVSENSFVKPNVFLRCSLPGKIRGHSIGLKTFEKLRVLVEH